jgi:hypothetical protein
MEGDDKGEGLVNISLKSWQRGQILVPEVQETPSIVFPYAAMPSDQRHSGRTTRRCCRSNEAPVNFAVHVAVRFVVAARSVVLSCVSQPRAALSLVAVRRHVRPDRARVCERPCITRP